MFALNLKRTNAKKRIQRIETSTDRLTEDIFHVVAALHTHTCNELYFSWRYIVTLAAMNHQPARAFCALVKWTKTAAEAGKIKQKKQREKNYNLHCVDMTSTRNRSIRRGCHISITIFITECASWHKQSAVCVYCFFLFLFLSSSSLLWSAIHARRANVYHTKMEENSI